MDIHASLRMLRMSPRKVRLVIDAIRGLSAERAETLLQFMKKDAAEPVLKLLRSAMANAEHNFQLKRGDLMVKFIVADGGPTLKRFQPRAFGRGAPIRKRTTHISLILAPKSEVKEPRSKVKESRSKTPRTKRDTEKQTKHVEPVNS
ncbi:50S ribosomal protein L22 [Candidatus Uhrbacteria bacterium]|nr:50S ribosomal protein L22 [Candidatus Uhrbacteria bacterium]